MRAALIYFSMRIIIKNYIKNDLLMLNTQSLIKIHTGNDLFDFAQNKLGLVIATSVAIVSGIFALSSSLAPGSARAARQFIDTVQDPTNRLSSHFKDLIKWIGSPKDRGVVVFIDDLDRCQSEYTVDILERIQTLFRDVRVIYVVAADRRWIYTSYDKVYDAFKRSMYEPGRPLRFLFLEKIFQLSVPIPRVDDRLKQKFWEQLLLNRSKPDQETYSEKLKEAARSAKQKFEKLNTEPQVLAEINKGNKDTINEIADRGEAIVRLASLELEKDIESRLIPFAPLLEGNPRLMKRVVNAYTIARSIEIQNKGKNMMNFEKLALKTILSLRWPRLDEYLERQPKKIAYIGNKKNRDGEFESVLPEDIESEIPKDLRTLFYDKQVIDVVRGNAPAIDAFVDYATH